MNSAASTDLRDAGTSDHSSPCWEQLIVPSSPASWRLLGSGSLAGRRVLITGAGGSIGSALSHAAAASRLASLVLLDSSENGLYQVDRSLHEAGSREHISLLGSVCNSDTLDRALTAHRPEIIFHAAALKHVPLMEQKPFAAIENNVFGTYALAHSAIAHEVEQIIHVSTDKAVKPRSIMGASKRVAELILLSLAGSTRMKVVRLCNVMGSQGSVLPLFLEQIASGGHVTVTHPDAERYFITLDETVRTLFDTLDVASTKKLLLPRIGPAVRIVDLARYLISLHQSPVSIEFTGLRPGDKLSEQLLSSRETVSSQGKVGGSGLQAIDTPIPAAADVNAALDTLRGAVYKCDLPELLRGIKALVPEYQPSSLIMAASKDQAALELATEIRA
ncbi:polysaccharide biosynthesis protein [Granulicella sp. L46]|uniref:polysaccharide biosynthesis protein n=1 Tax=Granulicella sp. L46 TaxID=1641865 RepID=UPI00131D2559|nr:polysaccharide biosynthesis protein [Granulicella sp. L46]